MPSVERLTTGDGRGRVDLASRWGPAHTEPNKVKGRARGESHCHLFGLEVSDGGDRVDGEGRRPTAQIGRGLISERHVGGVTIVQEGDDALIRRLRVRDGS